MANLEHGLLSIEQGEGPWRVTLNSNLSNIYTVAEVDIVVDGKAEAIHTHSDYFPLPELVAASDLSPVLDTLTSDVAFSSTYGPCLVDRVTLELFKISVNSGTVVVTGTGEFVGIDQNIIDVNDENMVAVYDETINGEVV